MQTPCFLLLSHLMAGLANSLTCTSEIQQDIFSSLEMCSSIPTTISLRNMIKSSNVLQVIPSHVTVNRCSGSCNILSHTCEPISLSYLVVPVMMVMTQWPHGEHQLVCDQVKVEVHQNCSCGCEITPQDCHLESQYHHQASCRYNIGEWKSEDHKKYIPS